MSIVDSYDYNDPEAVAADDSSYEGDMIAKEDRLEAFASAEGDISEYLDATELASLGARCVEDWQRDKASNQSWRMKTEAALKQAAQDGGDIKTFPWMMSSNVQFPLLTIASQQFAARAYPAIVKGDEVVGVKVLGQAPTPPDLPPPSPDMPPEAQAQAQQVMQAFQQSQQLWQAKQARAKRVKTWMNTHILYGMDDWEGGVDILLNQLPIVGSAFKKVYFDPHRGVCSDYVSALHLTVAKDTQSLERCPRVTQDFQLYPYEIRARAASGVYRDVVLPHLASNDDDQAPREVLEQHRLEDMDGDGIEEPYIITVDVESSQVLRIEAAFSEDDIARSKRDDSIVHIRRWMPFVHFYFLPDPEGGFYGLGFGQLLQPLMAVINTAINQLMDAGTAAAAGGGFIGSGVRLQGAGQSSTLRFQPGEYKYVNSSGAQLREAIWERTIPQPSPVLFQLLDLILGAAKDVASIKDVLSGDTPANAPVGTTLALIEQGLQSFAAIYKRYYRSGKQEFKAIFMCQGRWGSQEEYVETLDDPQANLKADFSEKGDDIVPVSDPSVVTRAQALAKAQVIQQTAAAFPDAINHQVAAKRVFEAAQIDNPEELINQPPKEPPPQMVADIDKTKSETALNLAKAKEAEAGATKDTADARATTGEAQAEGATHAAFALGSAHAGGVPDLEGTPGNAVGAQGNDDGLSGAIGELGGGELDAGSVPGGLGGPEAQPGGVADAG